MAMKVRDLHLNNKSRELLDAEVSQHIKVDHIAFTFPLSALRHCRKAGRANTPVKVKTGTKTTFFTGEKVDITKSIIPSSIYPDMPEIENFKTEDNDDFEKYREKVHSQLASFYEETLTVWVDDVLGMEMSPLRGKGFHGYRDSMTLKANGVSIGHVGIGGQRDTVYFQISGTGCKHLFSHTTAFRLHHWLCKVFAVSKLSRIDLAYDDFDDNFNCEYAQNAYRDNFFRTNPKARSGAFGVNHKFTYDDKGAIKYSQEMVTIGSRTSAIYWRVYNKKLEQLEQGIETSSINWYRSEAELKKWDIDCLLNISATFAGLCPYASQVDLENGVKTKSVNKQKEKVDLSEQSEASHVEAFLTFAGNVRHVRRSAGRALGDILQVFDGDVRRTIAAILPTETGGKFGLPPTYRTLIEEVTRENNYVE